MTLPHERINALRATHRFLLDLLNPTETPRVPRAIRRRASACLKHYPWLSDIEDLETSGIPAFDTEANERSIKKMMKALSSHNQILDDAVYVKKGRSKKKRKKP